MIVKSKRIKVSLKAKAVVAAVRGDRTINEWASQSGVHPIHITLHFLITILVSLISPPFVFN